MPVLSSASRRRRRSSGDLLVNINPQNATSIQGSTFTRTVPAYQVDQNGIYQAAGVNQLRNNHYTGLQYRTNHVLQSSDFSAASWSKVGTAGTTGKSDPLGGTSAYEKIVSAAGTQEIYQNVSGYTSGATLSTSFWCRLVVAGTGTGIKCMNPFNVGLSFTFIPTTTWQRFSGQFAAQGTSAGLDFVSADGSVWTIQLWGAQQEEAPATTNYIPTTTVPVTVVDGGTQGILLEGARTNSLLNSSDLSGPNWILNGAGTRVSNAVGLSGGANTCCTVADNDAAAYVSVAQSVTVPVDSNTHCVAYWVRKDTDQTRFPLIFAQIVGGTTVSRGVSLNTQTGAIVQTNIAGTGTGRVVDAGLWWVVEITLTNNSTALNTTFTPYVFPARSTVIGVDNIAATGSCIVGQVQVELNSSFYSSPIFTTTVAVNRAADLLIFPANLNPLQPFTAYVKGIEIGTVLVGSGRYTQIGSNAQVSSFNVKSNGSGALVAELYNGTFVASGSAGSHVMNDSLEFRAQLTPAGLWSLSQSVNGGAESAQVSAAYGAFPPQLAANTIALSVDGGGGTGFFVLQAVKIASGVRSLAEMRAA